MLAAMALKAVLATCVAFASLLGPWLSLAMADSGDAIPGISIGAVGNLHRDWESPVDCFTRWGDIKCVIEAFLVCRDLDRPDLCAHAGWDPEPNSFAEELIYGFAGETDLPTETATLLQYRAVAIATRYTTYRSPLLIVELDTRRCGIAAPESVCERWMEHYLVVWQPDRLVTLIAAWGLR